MKITKIETSVCHARMRNWVIVKGLTDQPDLFPTDQRREAYAWKMDAETQAELERLPALLDQALAETNGDGSACSPVQ
jgi:hypothetical protein